MIYVVRSHDDHRQGRILMDHRHLRSFYFRFVNMGSRVRTRTCLPTLPHEEGEIGAGITFTLPLSLLRLPGRVELQVDHDFEILFESMSNSLVHKLPGRPSPR